ncbi:SH3 domain-binding glutamic acid-rich protein homolog [Daktulosphaira vitifoliae]|uniref:SH3 domain-binding glutamic acid-rich protein homolog n=1 Tax=Daktulosphaira vitifoliae TaxID=58002 RepID=UPI0021AA1A1E|nr:SH3 domain-binding glutamic acid-rich protein homolog [Daktulosphaira vitifoliae]
MVVKVYISGISGNKEVKKRQQRVTMILDSKNIEYNLVDITEPGRENDKVYMQTNSKTKDGSKNALPPQIFKNDIYCGDYDDFDIANEMDELDKFFDISTKKQLDDVSDVNDISNKIDDLLENTSNNENEKSVEEFLNELEEQSKSDDNNINEEEKDYETLDTQNKLNFTDDKDKESVLLPDDTNNEILNTSKTKEDTISENEEEIEE